MPASSRDKSARVPKVLSRLTGQQGEAGHGGEKETGHGEAGEAGEGKKKEESEVKKSKKSKKGLFPYIRVPRGAKKAKNETKGEGSDKTSGREGESDSQTPLEAEKVVIEEVLSEPRESAGCILESDVESKGTVEIEGVLRESDEAVTDCELGATAQESESGEGTGGVDFKTYSMLHGPHTAQYESPLKRTQPYQRSFLHGSGDDDAASVPDSSTQPTRPVPATRYHTLGPSSSAAKDFLELDGTRRGNTLDTVRARFHNHVSNLTYEGLDFGGSEAKANPSPAPSSWSLAGWGLNSPLAKLLLHSDISREQDKRSRSPPGESKGTTKAGGKKTLMQDNVRESGEAVELLPDKSASAGAGKYMKARLNITVVKNTEGTGRGRSGSFRFTRAGASRGSLRGSHRRRRHAALTSPTPTTDAMPVIETDTLSATTTATTATIITTATITTTTTLVSQTSSVTTTCIASTEAVLTNASTCTTTTSLPVSTTVTTQAVPATTLSKTTPTTSTSTTASLIMEGRRIPEYAKVNKRKNFKPDIVKEEEEEDGWVDKAVRRGATSPVTHDSPVEKAPVVKRLEAAGYKTRKDTEPTLKVNPVKRSESFKTGARVARRSSFTYTSRAKILEGESFVKTQAVKLRRKDSKNGRLDLKNARKAEYRLSVTIKPSTVATLANKFNTIISQNQAGGTTAAFTKSDIPPLLALHKAGRSAFTSPRAGIVYKNRQKFARHETDRKEGDKLLDEKSKKEEKNREQQRGGGGGGATGGEGAAAGPRRDLIRNSRSPSPGQSSTAASHPPSALEKLGDNKTDEEKVCEKIKTALSSHKFKGETDDSEDDEGEKDESSDDEEEYYSRRTSPSRTVDAVSPLCLDLPSSLAPAPCQAVSQAPTTSHQSLRMTGSRVPPLRDQLAPLPEKHAKSDSMDSGISTGGLSGAGSPTHRLYSCALVAASPLGRVSPTPQDSSLDTVVSTDTCCSEDSAIALRVRLCLEQEPGTSVDDFDEKDMEQEKEVTRHNTGDVDSAHPFSIPLADNAPVDQNGSQTLEAEEKGIVDLLESESKGCIDVASSKNLKAIEDSKTSISSTADPEKEEDEITVGDLEEKRSSSSNIDPELRSVGSSSIQDDTHSEVSSVCSEAAKSRRSSSRVQETKIYTAVKSAVKNTVKKTKEKDAERKEERERERRNRSPSADREKWYRRGRLRERRDKKKEDRAESEERSLEAGEAGDKEKEGKTYERFTFRKLREKSQERKRNKEKAKEEERKREMEKKNSSEESKKDGKGKKKEDKKVDDSSYGKWSIRSRSRSRDRKKHKEKIMEQIAKEEAEEALEKSQSEDKNTSAAGSPIEIPPQTSAGSSLTLPLSLRKKCDEKSVFTFDTDSIYDSPQGPPHTPSHSVKSMTLPPPPKTPIPSPPSSATIPLPPPPKTPIPDPPTETGADSKIDLKEGNLASCDKGSGDSDSSNETENIYENLYAPDLEKLQRNREKLEGRGIRPNSSFLWSEGGQVPTSSEPPQEIVIQEEESDEEPERSPFTRLIGVRHNGRCGRTGRAREGSGLENHNYAELHPTQDDTHIVGYDDIGAASTVSYDDIGAPSSCGYDDVRAPSTVGYDTIRPPSEGYDPVNPPRSDSSQYDDCDGGVVTAQFAVVREDQLDSISYMYDEISMYNVSQSSHSYEPVYPPGVSPRAAVSIIQEVPEAESPVTTQPSHHTITTNTDASYNSSLDGSQDGSESGVHEVFSYKLTRIGGATEATHTYPSTTTATTTPTTHTPLIARTHSLTSASLALTPSSTFITTTSTHISGVPSAAAPTPTAHGPRTPTTPTTPAASVRSKISGAPVPPLVVAGGAGETSTEECGGVAVGDATPSPSLTPIMGKSDTSDEWVDISDTETDMDIGVAPIRFTTQFPLVRMRQRSRHWRPRHWRRTWSQGVRDVAAHARVHTHIYTHTHTHAHAYVHATHTSLAAEDTTTSSSSHGRREECNLREGGESEEDDGTGGHYEAIYEVISPSQEEEDDDEDGDIEDDDECFQRQDDNEYDDSFDSDDSDDAYCRLRPQFPDEIPPQISRDHHYSLRSEVSSTDTALHPHSSTLEPQPHQQQHGITKIAEAANLGMRRLRRNWSQTKNEVVTGLSKIKKKGTFSASDLKSTENLASEPSPTSAEKRKWSFKNHFCRKSSSGSVANMVSGPAPTKKESATFYLTLTIEAGGAGQDNGELSDTSQRTVRSDSESVVSSVSAHDQRKSSTPSLVSLTTQGSADAPAPPLLHSESHPTAVTARRPNSANYGRKSSSGSGGQGPVRPRTAPPAPPPKDKDGDGDGGEGEELSKTEVASRLNQILSSGPMAPPGRRVLRTSDCSSSDTSPVPVLVHPDDAGYIGLRPNSVKYATIDASTLSSHFKDSRIHGNHSCGHGGDSSGDERPLGSDVTNSVALNVPNARTSVASVGSHGSSEGYIRPGDIASAPPPLPARRTPAPLPALKPSSGKTSLLHISPSPIDGDNNSYLDFSCNALIQDEPLYVSSHFADEPLYQFYTATVLERAAHNQGDCSSEDDYEVINDGQHDGIGGSGNGRRLQSRLSAMELVTPADGRRTLWCELPEVIESGLLNDISSQERKMQEAMFEMITSEASYLKSLNVLVTHFVQCPAFVEEGEDAVLSRRERHILFSDILPVKRCSELFLADLEKRWQESVRISNIADIICHHAATNFQVYIKYCSNQIYQDRTLKELKENNPRFLEVLNQLETSPVCQSLAMHSFLMLPMQRITRLPLLVDAIFHRLEYGTPMWHQYKVALATLTKIVAECNEGARKMERMEEMLILSRQLDFREVKAIPLISASRWLVKKGELIRLTWRENDGKLTFGKRISKCTLYFFLFTDLLVVTKKKSEDQYLVLDYCSRNMVQVLELDASDRFPARLLDGHKNLLIITMLQNHENKTVEMIVSCPMESDRTRWVEAVTPRSSDNPDERIYEEWDCPQVQAIHPYVGKQPDELSLEVSDVVNVLKKMSDGWYQGERIRDQERGWFPGSFTVEISSTHVRARNLRQRYRLLAISGTLLDELKKEKERYEKEEKRKDRRRTITMKDVISSQAQTIT